jgi:competence protein ComFC
MTDLSDPIAPQRLAAPRGPGEPRRTAGRVLSSKSILNRIIEPLLSIVLPSSCTICGKPEDDAAPLCRACQDMLARLQSHPACPACGKPLAPGSACGWCAGKGIPHFNRVARLGAYEEPLRGLIIQMKYHHRWPFAKYLARRLTESPSVGELLDSIDCIVPVPLHWRRQISRGYNQAELLARRISKHCGKPVIRAAARVRHTPTQTMLSPTARGENVRDAFALRNHAAIAGKRVLVIDDVLTTSATLQHLARALIKAQPKSLDALVLAVADPKHAGLTTS